MTRRDNAILPPSDTAIGIDWGVKSVATASEPGFDLECGNQTSNNAKELKEAHRRLSRAVNGSNGRKTAKKKVASIQIRIARQRKDRAFKWARKIVTAFGKIAIEDFKPSFLSGSTMAKKGSGSVSKGCSFHPFLPWLLVIELDRKWNGFPTGCAVCRA